MVVASTNKTPSKKRRSPAQERRSQSKALKEAVSPGLRTPDQKPHTSRNATYSHLLPTEEQRRGNGRVVGRSLIMWGRPRMAEKLLLHLHYECTRHKVAIPWDTIAHRLHPGSSGAAVVQHINRLRKELVSEGHLVPPVAQKPGTSSATDPNIRGYIRQDMHGEDRETVRPVYFGEKVEDAKFNLPDAFDGNELSEEESAMSASPTPQRPVRTPERPPTSRPSYQDIISGDGSIYNRQLPGIEQNWSPSSSFYSPTRRRDFDIDDVEDPLTHSFDTATTCSSASLPMSQFPSESLGQMEQYRDTWLRSVPHGMPVQAFSKIPTFFQGSIVPQLSPFAFQPLFTTDRVVQEDVTSLGGHPSSPTRLSQHDLKVEESPTLQEHFDFQGSAFEDALDSNPNNDV